MPTDLGTTLAALADPTRRAVVQRLVRGPATVGELAADHPISLPAFTKHVRVLADATRRAGFEHVVTEGPITATELASGRDISRQAVAKHLDVLDRAGLVHGERTGREVRFRADVSPLGDTAETVQL